MDLRFGVGLGVALVAAGGALSSCIFVYGEADTGTGGAGGFGGNPTSTSITTGGAGGGVGLGGAGGMGGTCGAPYSAQARPEVAELIVALDGSAAFIGPNHDASCGGGNTQLAYFEPGGGSFDDTAATWCADIPPDGFNAKERLLAISTQRVAVAFNVSPGAAKLMLYERANADTPTVHELVVTDGSVAVRGLVAADDQIFLAGTITSTNEVGSIALTVSNATCAVGEIAPVEPSTTRTFVARLDDDGSDCNVALAALSESDFESLAVNGKDVLMRRLLPSMSTELVRLDRAFTVLSNTAQRAGITAEAASVDYRRLAGAGDGWRTLADTQVIGGNVGACCDGGCCVMNANQGCCVPSGALWQQNGPSVLFSGVSGLTANPMNGDAFVFGLNASTPSVPRVLAVWDAGNATATWGPNEWPSERPGEVLGVRPVAEGAEVFTYAAGSLSCGDRWVLERQFFPLPSHP